MRIREIIKEELEGWEWAHGISIPKPPMGIYFDPPIIELSEYMVVAKILEEQGYKWISNLGKPTEWNPIEKGSEGLARDNPKYSEITKLILNRGNTFSYNYSQLSSHDQNKSINGRELFSL